MNTGKAALDYKEPSAKNRRLSLTISENALLKMAGLTEAFDGEAGWHGTVKRPDKTSFVIEDIFVYPQDASPASVDTDQAAYEKWLYSQENEVFNNMRMHGHSHARFGVTPSAKDGAHRNGLVRQLTGGMFYIFMIWNKKYEIHTMLYDRGSGLLYENRHIDFYAYLGGKRVSFKDLKIKEIKRLLVGNEISGFISGAKSVVKTGRARSAVSGLIRDKDIYGLLIKHAGERIRLKSDGLSGQDAGLITFIREKDGAEIMTLTDQEDSVSISWSVGDVKSLRPDLTDEECMDVLETAVRKHDSTVGLTWDTLAVYAENLFGAPGDSEIFGKFIRRSLLKLSESTNGGFLPALMNFDCVINGGEVLCNITLYQNIEKKRQYHYWYGGYAAVIALTYKESTVSGEIAAKGAIRVWLNDKEGTELCNIKDKSGNGGFSELKRYIPDDGLLSVLLEQKENEQGLSLTVDDSNWWELFTGDESDSCTVLDGYSFTDALCEAAAHLFTALNNAAGDAEQGGAA